MVMTSGGRLLFQILTPNFVWIERVRNEPDRYIRQCNHGDMNSSSVENYDNCPFKHPTCINNCSDKCPGSCTNKLVKHWEPVSSWDWESEVVC